MADTPVSFEKKVQQIIGIPQFLNHMDFNNQPDPSIYLHTTDAHNTRAAEQVVPILMNMFSPKSVLDVGCGTGTWIQVFNTVPEIQEAHGIDGHHIDMTKLVIPETQFSKHDLSKPLQLNRQFDLVISLEVAEHLPPTSADDFVQSLVHHGETIVFSAAVPGQGGYNHIHEQWPSYWIKQFARHGYQAYDILRPIIWNNKEVDPWYKQNVLVYSKKPLPFDQAGPLTDIIHPEFWLMRQHRIATFQLMHQRIKDGKAGLAFPLKSAWRSLLRGGKKSEQ